jgi:hypothetical protein
MPDLPAHAMDPERLADLRSRATSRLTGAAATKSSSNARAIDALSVLHALASSPESAADALALLHELQVHKVELDLQAQELQESRAELESALRRQIELYDFQPAGSFTIDARLALHELNQTGADLLGIDRDDAYGLHLDTFFCPEDAVGFRSAMSSVDAGMQRTACLVKLRPQRGPELSALTSIGKDPAADRYLVSLAISGSARSTAGARTCANGPAHRGTP